MTTNLTFAATFTDSGAPATGLTLSDIDLYLYSINKQTGAETAIWNSENPTVEYTGMGTYGKPYTSLDTTSNLYVFRAHYTGAGSVDIAYTEPTIIGYVPEEAHALTSATETQIDNIETDTNELQTDDVPGLIAALNDPTAAAIRAEIDSNSTQLAAIVADTNELQTDDVPGLIAALNDPTAATIAGAVWDEAKSGHVGAGSFGEEVQAHALSSEISGLNDITAQSVTDDLLGEAIESGVTFKTILLDLWSVICGNALADDADDPTSITYDSPDDSVQVTHTLTDTTRAKG